jgi:glycosyltransferase involved in cell wall biosynthesis
LPERGLQILLTGTFHSDNWIACHLQPLAASSRCARILMVASAPVPSIDKVEAIHAPRWLSRLVGNVGARLAWFAWTALRVRPDVVGGFHLLLNGMVAALVGRLVRAHAIYFCVGGPSEFLDGGIWAENRLFGLMTTPDARVEKHLMGAVRAFDTIVTMGTRAASYFHDSGQQRCFVVAGAVDPERFSPSNEPADVDLVLVGRLVPVKRVDLFLGAVAGITARRPGVSALIVGDGPLRSELENLAVRLGIAAHVRFAGQQRDVAAFLRRARIFVLTSDSEGLALSLMEAMSCGLAAVVSAVGDLGDLVRDGLTGYLVAERSATAFVGPLQTLLDDPRGLAAARAAAHRAALPYSLPHVARRWDGILQAGS